jgi:hypothetical protein
MPSIVHSAAFFISELTGSQEKETEYARVKARSSGTRMKKRNMWKGRYIPEGSKGMGKKGAMPEPIAYWC